MVILFIILIRPYMVWDIRMAQKLEPTSFGDEASEGKSVTGIVEETAVSVSALGISGARVYYVTVISVSYTHLDVYKRQA